MLLVWNLIIMNHGIWQ